MKFVALQAVALLGLLSVSAHAQNAGVNRLSPLERDAGWRMLFDGQTNSGWRRVSEPGFPAEGWEVVDGTLHHTRGGGDLVTEQVFGDFELEFEWKVAAGANSGVKYMVPEADAGSAYGPEYQVLDDATHSDSATPLHRASALYALFPAIGAKLAPVGEFNRGRIVSSGGRIEHWVNGERVVDIDTSAEAFAKAHAASKYRGTPDFARSGRGRIALQDHGDEVWFRSLRLRELPAASFEEVDLLPGEGLEGWTEYGDARYVREGRTILGEVDGGGQSFLLSKASPGDFIFEVDVMTEEPGNSGIQIRCHQQENGRPFGYQIEIDPSPRSWSGGLYDEARRGWLDDLEHNDAGRAAFVYQEWNRFRIECVGPWIRASVNGIPTADYFDLADIEGVFGLQVHSGNNTKVRWRNPRLWELGRRAWIPGGFGASSLSGTTASTEDGVTTLHADGPSAEVNLPGTHEPGSLTLRCSVSSPNGLELHRGAWSCDLGSLETYDEAGWNELGLCLDGERLTVLLNGRPVSRERLRAPVSGGFRLRFVGAQGANRLKNVELLSREARQARDRE